MFLVSDTTGDIGSHNIDGQGLYWRDTRFLSLYELTLDGGRPQLLSATGEYSFMTTLQFANAAFRTADGVPVPARSISIRRNRFLRGALHERIGVLNYNPFAVRLRVSLAFGSDFRDMFDVRGYMRRSKHGAIDPPRWDATSVLLGYTGLDGIRRETTVAFDQQPDNVVTHVPLTPPPHDLVTLPGISGAGDPRGEIPIVPPSATVVFDLDLAPGRYVALTFRVVPSIANVPLAGPAEPSLDAEFLMIRASYERWEASCTKIATDHEIFNAVLSRSLYDLRLLSDQVAGGYLPSAGIPWFSVPFGRDSLITALQTLSLQPDIACATLRFLAEHQGTEVNDWRDEQPGRILHEIRMGELATLGQVPHTPYYGSVDATPLFLIALGEYLRWTGDWDLGRQLRPNAVAALRWIDEYGDVDGDGYVEYLCRSENGIRNQGWKDSGDAIRHRDGRAAEGPIALAEIQGYVYAAKVAMAGYFAALGESASAESLLGQAAELRRRFNDEWWIEREDCFALALDRDKEPLVSVSSNPGHCLWSGLVDEHHAGRLADRLVSDDLLCGWGIRTLSAAEPTFNPMSYHNGSVWPHDNSLIVAGLARYGMDARAARVADEVFDAAVRFPSHRLPELYCGFARDWRYFSMPAQYPVSCSPQAWAAGSVFLIVQALLGLEADATADRLVVRPTLLDRFGRLSVKNLRVGQHRVSFDVRRENGRAVVDVPDGAPLEVVVGARGLLRAGS